MRERWKYEYDNDTGPNDEGFWEWYDIIADEGSYRHVAKVNKEADAKLIAAAPELIQVLKDIMDVIATDQLVPESVSYMRQARAAIKKATA